MKPHEEMTLSINNERADILCIEKQIYLLFTIDNFYEINYEELEDKINEI